MIPIHLLRTSIGSAFPSVDAAQTRPAIRTNPSYDALYSHRSDHRAVISGESKLVSDWECPWEIFNLAIDRAEIHDLAKTQASNVSLTEKMWSDSAKSSRSAVYSSGGEPIYRHPTDASESYVVGGNDTGDEEMRKPGRKVKEESEG